MPAWSISATDGPWRSRSSRTITRARLSPSKAQLPVLAELFATFLHGRAAGILSQLAAFWANCERWCPGREAGDRPATTEKQIAANRRLFTGVVSGIAHYGNCIGVPTIGGEVYFDESFEGNPLVNVFCLGVLRHEQLARGAARGVGNPVFYVGAETGRDGLAGAAFASRELTEESRQDRPAVQVGDPFKEKLLLEACLELLATDAVAGIKTWARRG